jgi:hypothetical protein
MKHYENFVDGLSADAVQKMAKRIFDFNELKQFVLMPEEKKD